MQVGPLVSTRMACISSPANQQETKYLATLQKADRVEVDATGHLVIHTTGETKPLRFARMP